MRARALGGWFQDWTGFIRCNTKIDGNWLNRSHIDMAVRGANGDKVGMLRNHSEKTTQESVPEHKEDDNVFKKPKTPKKAREKKVGISFLLIYL